MRFPVLLAVGVALIVGGVSLSEYSRRHPPEKKKKDDPKDPAKPPEAAPLPSLAELTSNHNYVYDAPSQDDVTAAGKHFEELTAAAKPLANVQATTVLGGTLNARTLVKAGDGVALWVEQSAPTKTQSRLFSLVWLGASSKVLVTGRANVGPIASDGKRIVWAEQGRILSVTLDAPMVKGVTEFGKANVTAISVDGDDIVAMLTPSQLDPFSTDPASALVKFGADRNVKTLASGLVRPQDAVVGSQRALFIAGYPSSLQSVNLDGSDLHAVSERAEPPLLLHEDRVIFRRGSDNGGGLYQVGIGGGEPQKVADGDIEKASLDGDHFVYALGTAVHLQQGSKDEALMDLPSTVLEVGAGAGFAWALTRDDGGQLVLVKKPLK
jgi:hypothetical protein